MPKGMLVSNTQSDVATASDALVITCYLTGSDATLGEPPLVQRCQLLFIIDSQKLLLLLIVQPPETAMDLLLACRCPVQRLRSALVLVLVRGQSCLKNARYRPVQSCRDPQKHLRPSSLSPLARRRGCAALRVPLSSQQRDFRAAILHLRLHSHTPPGPLSLIKTGSKA